LKNKAKQATHTQQEELINIDDFVEEEIDKVKEQRATKSNKDQIKTSEEKKEPGMFLDSVLIYKEKKTKKRKSVDDKDEDKSNLCVEIKLLQFLHQGLHLMRKREIMKCWKTLKNLPNKTKKTLNKMLKIALVWKNNLKEL